MVSPAGPSRESTRSAAANSRSRTSGIATPRGDTGPPGFDRVRTEPVESAGRFGADPADAADLLLGSGPGRHLLTLLDPEHPADAAPRVRAAFTAALAPHHGPDGVRLRTAAHLVTAVRR
ncbi:hypothetical protein [Kitasatospora cineracea]|uniref:hypothetical protein n=1 Tax=Kitasatospora cineracea TaxID=88074 RepID=UPI00369F4CE6